MTRPFRRHRTRSVRCVARDSRIVERKAHWSDAEPLVIEKDAVADAARVLL